MWAVFTKPLTFSSSRSESSSRRNSLSLALPRVCIFDRRLSRRPNQRMRHKSRLRLNPIRYQRASLRILFLRWIKVIAPWLKIIGIPQSTLNPIYIPKTTIITTYLAKTTGQKKWSLIKCLPESNSPRSSLSWIQFWRPLCSHLPAAVRIGVLLVARKCWKNARISLIRSWKSLLYLVKSEILMICSKTYRTKNRKLCLNMEKKES